VARLPTGQTKHPPQFFWPGQKEISPPYTFSVSKNLQTGTTTAKNFEKIS
jgi:hypothetical protein